jgi:fumarate reductase flavoprotein subunit
MNSDYSVDVAVVGGGACGLVAALQAVAHGAQSVAIFEKSTTHGCNSRYSSGSLAAGGTRWQKELGIDDSPDCHADDVVAYSDDAGSAEIVRALCRAAPRYLDWLADELDYPIELGVAMQRAGQSTPRLHTDKERIGGPLLIDTLRKRVEQSENIAFVDNTPAVGLIGAADGVHGIEISETSGVKRVSAGNVVLAADGFAANRDMMARYCPDAVDRPYGGVSTSTGDAISWGIGLGARVRNMGSVIGHGYVVHNVGTRLDPALPFLGAVIINRHGDRFVEETACGYSKLSGYISQQPGSRALIVWDEPAMEVAHVSKAMRESAAAGAYKLHADLAVLAGATGIPLAKLEQACGGEPAEPRPRRPLAAPYYAAWLTAGVLTTQGGLEVDPEGRVQRKSGGAIPHLFAGGGTAAGISGAGSAGYSSGNGLLSAMGFGWIIGRMVGREG